jgi:hypothetical protein
MLEERFTARKCHASPRLIVKDNILENFIQYKFCSYLPACKTTCLSTANFYALSAPHAMFPFRDYRITLPMNCTVHTNLEAGTAADTAFPAENNFFLL